MTYEATELRAMRAGFMRAAYRYKRPPLGFARKEDILRGLGCDPDIVDPYDMHDCSVYRDLAHYWKERGYIESYADGHELIKISARGIQYVEGNMEQQTSSNVTFDAGNAYQSLFGVEQHGNMNVSYDSKSVEAELDRAGEEI